MKKLAEGEDRNSLKKGKLSEKQKEEIKEKSKSVMYTYRRLAEEYNVSIPSIVRVLNYNPIKNRKGISKVEVSDLREDYEKNGHTIPELMKKYGFTEKSIIKILNREIHNY